MKKGAIFYFLLTLMFITAFIYSADALYRYFKLSRANTPAKIITLEITPLPLSDEEWTLKANYSYLDFHGEEILEKYVLKNQWAAEQEAESLKKTLKWVWYSPKNPELSTLVRDFPTRKFIYSFILWGLFIYFLILRCLARESRKT